MHHRQEVGYPVEIDGVFDRELSGTIALAGCGSVDIRQPFCDSESRETGAREGTGLAVNLAAVDAIAWQTRLRNFDGGTTIRAQDRGRDRSDCDRARFQIVPV